MRSIKLSLSKKPADAWEAAVLLVEVYFSASLKADQVMDLLQNDFIGQQRASCQSLFLGALRHGHRTCEAYRPMIKRAPSELVQAILLVAGFELFSEQPEKHPKIVHHAVEKSKGLVNRHQRGFLNAVLRKLPAALCQLCGESATPANRHSHPNWLVAHWLKTLGQEDTESLLTWNQTIPERYVRVYEPVGPLPDFLEPTQWNGFYGIGRSVNWTEEVVPLLQNGQAYVKDPSTRLAPALLSPGTGMDVLDLCAAPGGKSFDLSHRMNHNGRIVAVDLPGSRIERLKDNLAVLTKLGLKNHLLECDVLDLNPEVFSGANLPLKYDAVMLDAPCSNTGVIQRRTDVKWRLEAGDLQKCAKLQLGLLLVAASCVKPGGRLVYSTCSIEKQENQDVVDAFLRSETGKTFRLSQSEISKPWISGHDGAGAFLLVRDY